MMYTYRAFNLRIASQIELPELHPQPFDQPPDVTIQIGAVPDTIDAPTSKSLFFERNRRQFLLRIPQTAAFWVEDGRSITVEALTDEIDLVRAMLLDTVMVALLYQRDLCVLHASCIDTPNGAVILANTRGGNGCSTLAAALRLRGYPVAADIFTAVDVQSTPPLALPAYPFQLLWYDSLKQLGIPVQDSPVLPPVRAALKKYIVPLDDTFAAEARPIWRIYMLQAEHQLAINPISGLQKLEVVERLLYHGPFQEADQAGALVALGRGTQIFALQHKLAWNLSALVEAFEAHLSR